MEAKAVAFVEEAIRALARKDAGGARTAIAEAYDVDHSLGAVADAIYFACWQLEEDGRVTTAAWNTLADAVGPGPLSSVVEESRS